jgi:hypothetical protein
MQHDSRLLTSPRERDTLGKGKDLDVCHNKLLTSTLYGSLILVADIALRTGDVFAGYDASVDLGSIEAINRVLERSR